MNNEPEEHRLTGIYQHYNGNKYKILHLAKHSETLELLVVYQQLYGDKSIWVRPYSMFLGQVEVEGELINRFNLIEND